jgi:hypothetical protein
MRFTFLLALSVAVFSGVLTLMTPQPAHALTGIDRQALAVTQDRQLVEEAASRRKRVAKRQVYRRPSYAPYFCSRPYKYYYWQFWPPVCYPL